MEAQGQATAAGPDGHPWQRDAGAARQVGMEVAHHAWHAPDRTAVFSPVGDRSFGELNAAANRLARALRRRGLVEGDGVAILSANRPEFVEVAQAARRAGLRVTPINWHLTAAEAAYILEDSEARALLVDARFGGAAAEAVAALPGCAVRVAFGGAVEGFDDYEAVLGDEDGSDIDDPSLGGMMLYTSGTTGRPKGVYRPPTPSLRPPSAMRFDFRPTDDLALCTGPLYHTAPFVYTQAIPLGEGVGVVLMDRWDAEETLRLIDHHGVTHTHLVPTMFHRLLAVPDDVKAKFDVSSLRLVLHGAAPCPVPVKQAMIDWFGPILVEYYSATEGTGCVVDSETWLTKPGTVGKPAEPEHIRILDEDGRQLPPGEVGLIYIRAPKAGRFTYFKDEGKTAESYRADYFTVKDMGYLDEDGYLFLTDRTANLVISGGVNIYPAEVDAVLLGHPKVGDVATIGIPDPEWGESVLAVVEVAAGVTPSPELATELIEFCRERLAHYKCPRAVEFAAELPREDNGKIYKQRLRDEYRARLGQSPG